MSNANQDLQASHRIISLLEQSKRTTESIIEELPEVFAIVDEGGKIIRGNGALANLLKCETENLLGRSIFDAFPETYAYIFRVNLSGTNEEKETREFELKSGDERWFAWKISPFEEAVRYPNLLKVVGHDITQLQNYEKKLSNVFSNIPIGFLTINSEGAIEEPYSTFTEWLLSCEKLAGRDFFECVFGNAINLSQLDKEGISNFKNFSNLSPQELAVVLETFPKRVSLRLSESDSRLLGLNYQPIAYKGKVKQMMILIEDRSSLDAKANRLSGKRAEEDRVLKQILALKTADQRILPLVMEDIYSVSQEHREILQKKDLELLSQKLHGLKGNARIVGFESLKEMAHELESKLKDIQWSEIEAEFAGIVSEIEELRGYYVALYERTALKSQGPSVPALAVEEIALRAVSQSESTLFEDLVKLIGVPSENFHSLVETTLKSASSELGKEVDFEFVAEKAFLRKETFSKISECLVHVLTNSVSHGVETKEERKAKSKPTKGSVEVKIKKSAGFLSLTVADDGAGVNVPKLRKKIESSTSLSDEEVIQYIFKHSVSTKSEEVDKLSGRGWGLSAVAEIIQSLGGSITAKNLPNAGTMFELKWPLEFERSARESRRLKAA